MALPRLELPADALVLFESVPRGLDRSGGYRFAVTADGRFLHGNNQALHVAPDAAEDDDPSRFWTGALEEVAQFGPTPMKEIEAAAEEVRKLAATTRRPPGKESEPTIERVTTRIQGITHTTIGYQRGRPEVIQRLLEAVERAGGQQA
jgi:hypothetical protein